MPRDIKFRAWDGIRITTSGIMFNTSNGHIEVPNGTQMKLMQYTGLKDKNGVEIYEGDILRRKNKWVATVEWYDKEAMFECTGWNITLDRDHLAETEVIGNIYENKELSNA